MLAWVLTGSDLTTKVDFQVGGALVIPDPGSVYLTIRDNAGAPIAPYNNQPQTVTGTYLELVIPALVNTPATPGVLESRYLLVAFTYEGRPYTLRQSYRLSPFLTMTVSEDSVRSYLGLMPEELENGEIDLYGAYYELLGRVSSLATLLQAGTAQSLRANKAIALQAAILLAPSLPARYAQRVVDADSEFARATKFDPNELVDKLEAELDDLINDLTALDPAAVTNPTRFLVGTRTDPITGA